MRGPVRRYPHRELIPVEKVLPLAEKIVAEHGGIKPAARYMAERYPLRNSDAWERAIQRILHTAEHVYPNVAEPFYLEFDLAIDHDPYHQRVWRVMGFAPWPSRQKERSDHIMYWYYIRKSDAMKRIKKLKQQSLFVEASYSDSEWRPVDGSSANS